MRLRASKRLLVPVLIAGALLLPLGFAAAEESGGLGELFRELLGGSSTDVGTPPADQGQPPKQGDEQAAATTEAPPPPPGDDKRVPFGRQEMELSFAPLVKNTAPAVVNVYASQQVRARSPFEGDPFFEQFFGDQEMAPRMQQSLGSGVLVDPSGIVVTNYHVIRNADTVKVATSDGREFEVKVLLKDESIDLAVLKLDSKDKFPTIPIGNSDALEVGDLVLAMGNPFGVGQTTTSGIVSALARSHIGISDFSFFIQTDAAINPGNSGGALINMRGELVGINTAIYSRSGGSIGIGFAIPSNMVRAVVASARSGNDYFERPYLGATFEQVTAQIAEALGLPKPEGALVSDVVAGGPAANAGIKPGDVVLAMNGTDIDEVEALGYRLATQPIGSAVTLDVLSQGKKKSVQVALTRAPVGPSTAEVKIGGRSPFAGAKVAELSPRLAQKLGLRTDTKTGVAIVATEPDSPAAGFGFQPKDIIREVNGEQIDTPEKLKEIAEQPTRWWRFTVERDGRLIRQMLRY
jgi:Do/DeqQ family serine protease